MHFTLYNARNNPYLNTSKFATIFQFIAGVSFRYFVTIIEFDKINHLFGLHQQSRQIINVIWFVLDAFVTQTQNENKYEKVQSFCSICGNFYTLKFSKKPLSAVCSLYFTICFSFLFFCLSSIDLQMPRWISNSQWLLGNRSKTKLQKTTKDNRFVFLFAFFFLQKFLYFGNYFLIFCMKLGVQGYWFWIWII